MTATGCFGNCLESMVRFFGAKIASKRHHSAFGMRYIIAMINLIEGSPQRHIKGSPQRHSPSDIPATRIWIVRHSVESGRGRCTKKRERRKPAGPPRLSLPVMGGYALTYDSNLDFILRRIAFMRS